MRCSCQKQQTPIHMKKTFLSVTTGLLAAFAALWSGPTVSAQVNHPEFKLFVLRKASNQRCTLGYLGVQSPHYKAGIIAYTMERPWRDNKQNISAIPAGTYSAIVRYD